MSGFSCVSVSQQGGTAHKTMLRRHAPFVLVAIRLLYKPELPCE
jgi:hypothetical protein